MGLRIVTALVVTALGCVAFHGVAIAAPGALTYDGCFANDDGAAGCTALPGAPISGAGRLAVTPDGSSVYVASYASNSVAHFVRSGPDGELSFEGCLANNGAVVGCADLAYDSLSGAHGVVVSPDGKSVYVTSSTSDTLAQFSATGTDGKLAYVGCLGSTASYNCGDLPGLPLDSADGVTVSPDGRSLYVASGGSNSVSHFFRNADDGQVTFDGCLASTAAPGCTDLDGAPLDGAYGVSTSPDGKSVYVASPSSNSVAGFQRTGAEGQIAFGSCLMSGIPSGCPALNAGPLFGAPSVAVSPDGASVYVVNPAGGAVLRFRRSADNGTLAFADCLSSIEQPFNRCVDLPGAPMYGASDIAISPDGASLYVTGATGGGTVAWFSRAGDGALTFQGCVAGDNDLQQGCVDLPGEPLRGAQSVEVSPDGRSVYVASRDSNSVARFQRALDDGAVGKPDGSGGPGGSGGQGAGMTATCGGKAATIVGTKRADRLRGTAGRDVIAAGGGDDRVAALGGDDVVCGGRGRDTLRGGRGRDRLLGGPQRDTCVGGAAHDRAAKCEIRKSL